MEKAVHVDEGTIGKTLLAFALPVLATQLLQEDPALEKEENALLRERVEQLFRDNADSFN